MHRVGKRLADVLLMVLDGGRGQSFAAFELTAFFQLGFVVTKSGVSKHVALFLYQPIELLFQRETHKKVFSHHNLTSDHAKTYSHWRVIGVIEQDNPVDCLRLLRILKRPISYDELVKGL